jgi:hypothetical protein
MKDTHTHTQIKRKTDRWEDKTRDRRKMLVVKKQRLLLVC